MKLEHFLRVISCSLFTKRNFLGLNYNSTRFYIPRIICVDGFSISIQINYVNYCESESGYRELGYEWKRAEWGFPSNEESLLVDSAEDPSDTTNTVGSETIEILQSVLDNHGGISWEKTLSVENCKKWLPLP